MSRKMPGITAVAALVSAALMASACVTKDPKSITATIPNAAYSHDAMFRIGEDGSTTALGMPPSLCADPQFGRPTGRRSAGAVTIPCWDGS